MVAHNKDPKDTKDSTGKDSRMLMEAINTLEACRTYNNAAVFFEEVCQPSRSAKAKRLTEAYVRLEFGKRAMLRCAPQHWRRIQRISSARTAL